MKLSVFQAKKEEKIMVIQKWNSHHILLFTDYLPF